MGGGCHPPTPLTKQNKNVLTKQHRSCGRRSDVGPTAGSLASATDPGAAHAEVTAAHREARAQVDAAETARDRAVTAARTAAAETEVAQAAQRQAEQAAEEALTAVEDVELERDRARADLARITEELEHTKALARGFHPGGRSGACQEAGGCPEQRG
jgi:hypothetical protein